MTSKEINQVVLSIERSFTKTVKVTKEEDRIYKISLPFTDRHGQPFYIWSFRYAQSRKIQLSDGRMLTRDLGAAGTPQLALVKELAGSYGLSLMEDLSVMDITDRPLTQRVTAFLSALVGIDAVLRMWQLAKENTQSA